MATKAGAQAGDGGGGAAEGACDLAMGGSGLEQGGDGAEELRALQVIEKREAVLGEGAAATPAEEARDAPAATGEVGAVEANREMSGGAPMFGAGGPGAEAGSEIVHSFEGGPGPAHEG